VSSKCTLLRPVNILLQKKVNQRLAYHAYCELLISKALKVWHIFNTKKHAVITQLAEWLILYIHRGGLAAQRQSSIQVLNEGNVE